MEGICEQQAIDPYLIRLSSGTFRIKEGPVELDITHIEQLIILESVLSTSLDVWFDVVEFTKTSSEVKMCLVREAGLPEDDDAILIPVSVLSNTGAHLRASTTYLRKGSSNLGKDLISDRSREVDTTYLRCESRVQLLDFDVVEGRGVLFRDVGHFASFSVLMLVKRRYLQAYLYGFVGLSKVIATFSIHLTARTTTIYSFHRALMICEVAHT